MLQRWKRARVAPTQIPPVESFQSSAAYKAASWNEATAPPYRKGLHRLGAIRFHFKPNIDGYAYIQVAEGATGEKATLFPSAELSDNKVKCGEEIVLPFAKGTDQAWLRFDDHPGTETVRIVVSRTPIDLNSKGGGKGTREVESDLKLSSSTTHADKIPNGTFVSMDEPTSGSIAGSRGLSLEVRHAPEEAGQIAVVNADPKKELAIDISLEHKKKGP